MLKDEDDRSTRIRLVFANTTEDDILLHKELEKFAQKYPDRLKVSSQTPGMPLCNVNVLAELQAL